MDLRIFAWCKQGREQHLVSHRAPGKCHISDSFWSPVVGAGVTSHCLVIKCIFLGQMLICVAVLLSPPEQGDTERDGANLHSKPYQSINLSLFFSVSPQLLLSNLQQCVIFVSADTNPNPDLINVSGKTSNNFNCTRTWLTVKKMLF